MPRRFGHGCRSVRIGGAKQKHIPIGQESPEASKKKMLPWGLYLLPPKLNTSYDKNSEYAITNAGGTEERRTLHVFIHYVCMHAHTRAHTHKHLCLECHIVIGTHP